APCAWLSPTAWARSGRGAPVAASSIKDIEALLPFVSTFTAAWAVSRAFSAAAQPPSAVLPGAVLSVSAIVANCQNGLVTSRALRRPQDRALDAAGPSLAQDAQGDSGAQSEQAPSTPPAWRGSAHVGGASPGLRECGPVMLPRF